MRNNSMEIEEGHVITKANSWVRETINYFKWDKQTNNLIEAMKLNERVVWHYKEFTQCGVIISSISYTF